LIDEIVVFVDKVDVEQVKQPLECLDQNIGEEEKTPECPEGLYALEILDDELDGGFVGQGVFVDHFA